MEPQHTVIIYLIHIICFSSHHTIPEKDQNPSTRVGRKNVSKSQL